jgi:hypothetical protein
MQIDQGLSTLRGGEFSLSVNALGAVTAKFHENTGTASLAADSVSLSMERFQAPQSAHL